MAGLFLGHYYKTVIGPQPDEATCMADMESILHLFTERARLQMNAPRSRARFTSRITGEVRRDVA